VAEEGEVLSPGSVLFTMVNPGALYMKAYAPNEQVGMIKLGDKAKVYLDACKDKVFEGIVTEISEQAEFTPKNVETKEQRVKLVFGIKISVDNPSGEVKPGMPGEVTIEGAK